jgi:hypothetical protein
VFQARTEALQDSQEKDQKQLELGLYFASCELECHLKAITRYVNFSFYVFNGSMFGVIDWALDRGFL